MKYLHRFAAPLLATVSIATLSHAAAPQVTSVATAAPATAVDFEVFLPLRNKAGLEALLKAQQTVGSASYHKWLTPAQFATRFGPLPTSLANVEAKARADGLQVTAVHTRSFHVSGAAAQASKFLGTSLNTVSFSDGRTRLRAAKPAALPSALQQEGVVVAAFTNIPDRRPNSKVVASNITPQN
ncbi:MAG TPA: protease pro-enzyme activation domain-containing protein, partial [Caulobacteraceae bacterium]